MRLEALPGIQAASLYSFGLLSGSGWSDRVLTEGYLPAPDEDLTCQGMLVGPRFFETLGIKILSGRDFTQLDERAAGALNGPAPQVAVINEAMACGDFFLHHSESCYSVCSLGERILANRSFKATDKQSLAVAKLLAVPFPVALKVRQDALVFGVRAQVVPVLVALEPWVVVVAYFVCTAQPSERCFFLAQ